MADTSSDLPDLPLGSSPPTTDSLDLGELPTRPTGPNLPPEPTNNSNNSYTAPFAVDLSSDPLQIATPFPSNFASSHRLSRNRIRKRGLSSPTPDSDPIDKEPRTSQNKPTARELVLQARDLLLEASTRTELRDEQSRLLDLLEIFREYTEKGRLQHTSSIIASQVANLESATRKIETKARALAQPSPDKPTNQSPLMID